MRAVLDRALSDAEVLTAEGFDGIIVENFGDAPYFSGPVPSETVAAMAHIVGRVVDGTSLPVGVNVLRNDARSALSVAVATGGRFIRVNVHTGSMWTDQGLLEGRAGDTMRARAMLRSDVAILADVHVKHATPPAGQAIGDAAADTWHRGRADALIVSGAGTGRSTDLDDLRSVRRAVPDAPVVVGSGATAESVHSLLAAADGVIVGSAVMRGGAAGAGIDRARARAFMEAARA